MQEKQISDMICWYCCDKYDVSISGCVVVMEKGRKPLGLWKVTSDGGNPLDLDLGGQWLCLKLFVYHCCLKIAEMPILLIVLHEVYFLEWVDLRNNEQGSARVCVCLKENLHGRREESETGWGSELAGLRFCSKQV